MKNILLCKIPPPIDPRWATIPSFKCKGAYVSANGTKLPSNFEGKCFQIFEKQRCTLTLREKTKRIIAASLLTAATCGIALFSKKIRALFIKNYHSVYLAKPVYLRKEERKPAFYGLDLFDHPVSYYDGNEEFELSLKATEEDRSTKIYPFLTNSQGVAEKIDNASLDWFLHFFSQSSEEDSLSHFWDHALTSDEDRSFFIAELFKTDEDGCSKLWKISSENPAVFIKILKLFKEKNISVDFDELNRQGESLWKLWALSGHEEIVTLMLEIQPFLIEKIRELPSPPLIHYLLQKNIRMMSLFFQKMNDHEIPFSDEELWLTIWVTHPKFIDKKSFMKLDKAFKQKVWAAAQFFGYEDVIKHLKKCGMGYEKKLHRHPQIFPKFSDRLEAEKRILDFAHHLRSKKYILSHEEASILDLSNYQCYDNNFEKVQMYDYLSKVCEALDLSSIKPIETFAVIGDRHQELTLFLGRNQSLCVDEQNPVKVYSRVKESSARSLSIQEADHLASFLVLSRVETSQILITADEILINPSSLDHILEHPDFNEIEDFMKTHTADCDHGEILHVLKQLKDTYLEENALWQRQINDSTTLETPWQELFDFEGRLFIKAKLIDSI